MTTSQNQFPQKRKWSDRSLKVRGELDNRLKKVVDDLLLYMDVSLLSGHRSKEEQDALFYADPPTTQLQYPQSKHNTYPSIAVDVQPYPMPTKREEQLMALSFMAGHAILIGERHGIHLRWGGDWNRNGSVTDNNFDDLYHLEIVE